MKVEIILEVEVENVYQAEEMEKIFRILISKGALLGVKGGHTKIHFNKVGKFQGISFDYKPWWDESALDKSF